MTRNLISKTTSRLQVSLQCLGRLHKLNEVVDLAPRALVYYSVRGRVQLLNQFLPVHVMKASILRSNSLKKSIVA